MNLGFFRILIETCRGTTIFFYLLRQPLLKAFFHFFLLCLICALSVALFGSLSLNKMVDSGLESIRESCGTVQLSKNGLIPKKEPEKSRLIFSGSRLELMYIADPITETPTFDLGVSNAGVLWSPYFVAVWGRANEGEYILFPVVTTQKEIPRMSVLTKAKVNDYLRDNSIAGTLNISSFSLDTIANEVKIIATLSLLVVSFTQFFLIFLFFILTTATTRAFLGARQVRKLIPFRDYLALTLYVAFPGLLITSLFTILEISLISTPLIALISFMGYFLYVAYRIERWILTGQPSSDDGIGD